LRALPASPPALLTSGVLPVTGAIRALAEPLVRPKSGGGDESIRAFATRRFGRHAADVLADAMVSGIFAGDPDALSLEACFPDLPRMEREHGSVVKALIARARRPRPRLRSFAGGMEELVAALVKRIGSRLRLSCGVRAIEPLERGCRVALASGEVATADAVVVTCDAPAIGRLLGPRLVPPSDLDVPAAPIAVVCMGYPSTAIPRPLDGFGFLAPRRAGVRILGAVWESSIFDNRAPQRHVLLRAMVGGAMDPGAVSLDDAALVGVVKEDLRSVMGIASAPALAQVIRHRPGLPQYVLGHPERLRRLEQALSGFPGLHLGGHSFRGVGVNALAEDAARIASRIGGPASPA
jgi:oxygen-dependent protoporphyrinogen oxidase